MSTFKLAVVFYFSLCPLAVFSGQFYTHTFPSILKPGTEKTIVLPFPYKGLDEQEKKDTTLLLESRYMVLEKGSTKKALVGPLYPCHLIALTNGQKTIIFHYSLANKIEQLNKIAREVLKIKNSATNSPISGIIFANTTVAPEWAQRIKMNQIKSIKKIKKYLVEKLHIKDPNQIKEVGFSFGAECNENNAQEYYEYMDHCELANRYMLVDVNMNIFCTAPRKENFFNTDVPNEPFFSLTQASFHAFCKKILEAFTKNDAELRTHNPYAMNFLDIDKFKTTLTKTIQE